MPRSPLAGPARSTPALACVFALVLALAACGRQEPTAPDPAGTASIGHPGEASETAAVYSAPVSDRLDPDGAPSTEHFHPTDVLVEIDPDADWESTLADHGVEILEIDEDLELLLVRSTLGLDASSLANELDGEPGILSADVDEYVVTPEAAGLVISFDDGDHVPEDVADQDALDRLGLAAAQARATGSSVRVAVIDTGADGDHALLQTGYRARWDGIGNDDDPGDVPDGEDSDGDGLVDEAWGHGTHIAGLVATIAPDAEILVYRVLDSDGRGRTSRVTQAVKRAAKEGVDVINLSLGTELPTRPLEKALEFAQIRGAIVVASAGNRGRAVPVQYPAGYPGVLGVGSVDAEDGFSRFSNWGDALLVCAPGERILSAAPEGGWAVWTGTSQATAVVSGLVALLRGIDPTIDAAQALAILGSTGAPVTGIPDGADVERIDLDGATGELLDE
jgi:subtilisin family serine protease